MTESEERDETEQSVYDPPGGDQHDSAQPLDHRDLDDAESVGKKASEDLHGDDSDDEDADG